MNSTQQIDPGLGEILIDSRTWAEEPCNQSSLQRCEENYKLHGRRDTHRIEALRIASLAISFPESTSDVQLASYCRNTCKASRYYTSFLLGSGAGTTVLISRQRNKSNVFLPMTDNIPPSKALDATFGPIAIALTGSEEAPNKALATADIQGRSSTDESISQDDLTRKAHIVADFIRSQSMSKRSEDAARNMTVLFPSVLTEGQLSQFRQAIAERLDMPAYIAADYETGFRTDLSFAEHVKVAYCHDEHVQYLLDELS